MEHVHKRSFLRRLQHFIPYSFLCLRKGYALATFKSDLFAGISVGIIAFPLALAYAVGADIPPERGLFTAIIAGFVIAALGGSRVQIGGPTGTFIVILFDIISRHGFEGMIIASIIGGVILILFGLAGIGTYFKYIPYPVITGLTTGLALVIFTSQIKDFFGLHIDHQPVDSLGKWGAYFSCLATCHLKTFAVGFGTLGILIFFRRYKPHVPGSLIALILAGFVTWYFDIDVATMGSHYGELPRHLPSPSIPSFTFDDIIMLIPDGLTIAVLVSIESLLSAVVSEGMTGWRHQSNCELVAQGFANIGSVMFGGIPCAGALTRTVANVKSGAKTPISGMVHAVVIFLIMYFFAPFVSFIPLCSIAAVLVMVAWSMSEIHHFMHLLTAPKKDVLVLLTVFIVTVLVNTSVAVQIGMILAAFLFMKQMSDLTGVITSSQKLENEEYERNDPDALSKKQVPIGVEVYEINGPFFFGVADRLKNITNELERPPKVFILRMRKVPTIDASGMHALEEFYLECQRQGTLLILSGVKANPLQDLKRYHLDELIGRENIFSHINLALSHADKFINAKDKDPLKSYSSG